MNIFGLILFDCSGEFKFGELAGNVRVADWLIWYGIPEIAKHY